MFNNSVINTPRWIVVLTVILGTSTVSLNNSTLNPAVPEFMSVFSIGPVYASWIISAFMISMGMTMPLTGYFSQRFGNKNMYLTGLSIFLIGSVAGMLAPNMPWVIAARCIQGIASGLMIPLSLVLIFSVYAKHERGYITGIWGATIMLVPAVGPLIGGLLLEFSSWRMLFAINIPVGVIGLLFAVKTLPSDKDTHTPPFDWLGFVLIFIGLGLLMLIISSLKSIDTMTDSTKVILLGLSIIAIVAFIIVELKKDQPLLNLHIFANKHYSFSIIIVVISAGGMFGCLILIPILIQLVLDYSPIWTGFVLLCSTISASWFVKFSGKRLDRHGPKYIVSIGILLTGLTTLLLGSLNSSISIGTIMILMIIRGMGIGLSYIPATTAGLNAVPDHLVAQCSAMNNILRRIISSITVIVVATYIESRYQQLTQLGLVESLANHAAISEVFRIMGLIILCSLPFAWYFPIQSTTKAVTNPLK